MVSALFGKLFLSAQICCVMRWPSLHHRKRTKQLLKRSKMKFNYLFKVGQPISNHEGAKAYLMTPEYQLYAAVVTTGLNASFYESSNKRLERIQTLMKQCSPEFVAKLACYARNEMYMRSVPLVLSVELAKMNSGNTIVSKTVSGVVQRADEITELLAYYQMANQRTGAKKLNRLSKQLQKGLVSAFNKFDEYQFAKYNKATAIKLKDALFLVHPKAKDEAQQNIFDKIATDALAVPYTWETELSALGQVKYENEKARKDAFSKQWEALIDSRKMGYMALLRNLRNIMEAEVSGKHMAAVCDYLSNAAAVNGSKQLPFRFLAAYRELKDLESPYTSMVLDALEDAVLISARNIKGFDVETAVVIACDVSGSMQKAVAPRSKILLYDIGLMLGMLLQSRCRNVVSGMFGDYWKVINMPRKSVLSNVNEYYRREGEVGYSTNGYLVLEDLVKRRQVVDKVMLFTDMQLWDSKKINSSFAVAWRAYKNIAPKAKLYLFDLAGYGNTPVEILQNDVFLIAGWSDKIFDMLDALENGSNVLDKINTMML
jgi:60 kDa SS-A/Ro ribonucleoprotein